MKKLLAIALVAAMLVPATIGCSGGTSKKGSSASPSPAPSGGAGAGKKTGQ